MGPARRVAGPSARRQIQEIETGGGVPRAADVNVLRAQPDLERRVHDRLSEVPAHDRKVGPAEGHMQVEERLTVSLRGITNEADDFELLLELAIDVLPPVGIPEPDLR